MGGGLPMMFYAYFAYVGCRSQSILYLLVIHLTL